MPMYGENHRSRLFILLLIFMFGYFFGHLFGRHDKEEEIMIELCKASEGKYDFCIVETVTDLRFTIKK